MKVYPHRTAIKRGKVSAPLRDFVRHAVDVLGGCHFHDYGCGKGDDIDWLNSRAYYADGWDPHWKPEQSPLLPADIVLCSYVICVLPNEAERRECIQKAWRRVKPGGVLVLSTRTEKEIEALAERNKWEKYNDGYITGRETFQKGFSLESLEKLVKKSIRNISQLKPREDKKDSYSAVYVVKKAVYCDK